MDTRIQQEAATAKSLLAELHDGHNLAHNNLSWASALFRGIELAQEANQPTTAKGLAELGAYFADKWAYNHNEQAEEFKQIRESLGE